MDLFVDGHLSMGFNVWSQQVYRSKLVYRETEYFSLVVQHFLYIVKCYETRIINGIRDLLIDVQDGI